MQKGKQKTDFLEDVNLLSGVGIFLVVVGHLPFLEGFNPYQVTRGWIYSFHMPLFMALSGFLFAMFSRQKVCSIPDYVSFLKKKVARFIPAYVFTAVLLFFIKYVVGKGVSLKNPVDVHSFLMMFVNPMDKGFVIHLWFVYTLFLIFVCYPLFSRVLVPMGGGWQLVFYFLLSLLPITHLFCLNLVFRYLIYFHLGGLLLERRNKPIKGEIYYLLGTVFLFWAGIYARSRMDGVFIVTAVITFLIACLGIVSCYFFVLQIMKSENVFRKLLNVLGLYSFEIYLFHTLGSETIGYFLRFLFHGGMVFNLLILGITTTFCGLYVPIIFTRGIVKYSPKAAKLLFGRT